MMRFLLSCLLLAGCSFPLVAQDLKPESVPNGATVRLGSQRFRDIGNDYAPRLHPDGKRIVVKDNNGASLYDTTTGEKVGTLLKGGSSPTSYSDSLSHAIVSNFSGIQVVTVPDGKKLLEFKQRKDAYSDTYTLSGDGNVLAKVMPAINPKTDKDRIGTVSFEKTNGEGSPVVVTTIHDTMMQCKLNTNGTRAITWGNSSIQRTTKPNEEPTVPYYLRLQCWDTKEGKELSQISLKSGYSVISVAISPAGDVLAVSSGNNVVLFDVATGKVLRELMSYRRMTEQLTFSAEGTSLAAASSDGAVAVWEVKTGKHLSLTQPPSGINGYVSIRSIVFTAPDQAVALAAYNTILAVWQVPSGKPISVLGDSTDAITAVSFAADDKELLTMSSKPVAIRWDLTGKKLGSAPLALKNLTQQNSSSFNWNSLPGSSGILSVGTGESTAVYDPVKRAHYLTLLTTTFGAPLIAATNDGSVVIQATTPTQFDDKPKPGLVQVYSSKDLQKSAELVMPAGTIVDIALSADGTRIGLIRQVTDRKTGLSTSFFNCISVKDGSAVCEVPLKQGYNRGFVVPSLDGKSMYVLPSGEQVLYSVNLESGEKGKAVPLPYYSTIRPQLSPDGKLLALSNYYGFGTGPADVAVLNLETGKTDLKFKGHGRRITCLAFSSDSKKLATGSEDTTVLLWDLAKDGGK
jgi:WD40 repeat protein